MKIARLELRAFGPFTDLTLELDAGDHGLHVIYGPNEAGKSSTLRALKHFLYGIPNRSSDNFVHAYPDLRIGAALRNGSGELLECIRRKATKNDLRAKDDVAPLDPARLARCLGGLDRDAFEAMFGIDHPTLVQGGREIVKGGGGLGQILFAAGSGIADLKAVQKRLDDAAAALFVPRGSVPKINKNLSEFDKAKKAIREAQLPSSEWEKHDKQLRQARERLAELESQLQMLRHERSRWERLREAAPLAAQRRRWPLNGLRRARCGCCPKISPARDERRLAVLRPPRSRLARRRKPFAISTLNWPNCTFPRRWLPRTRRSNACKTTWAVSVRRSETFQGCRPREPARSRRPRTAGRTSPRLDAGAD